jgi:cytochrome c peroxidase
MIVRAMRARLCGSRFANRSRRSGCGASARAVALALALLPPAGARVVGQPAPSGPEPISPVAEPEVADAAKLALGEKLFRDRRLSRGDVVACDSCHRLDQGGDDRHRRPNGLDGRPLDFNAPTIFNVALNFRLNWRGNFRTLAEQNEAVLLDPRLMGTNWDELLATLRTDQDYVAAFGAAYGARPERATVLDALSVFQRSLATPNARFDLYLRGVRDAITADEERGYRLFKAYGCIACHQGQNVGGNLFQKFGIFSDPFAESADVAESDLGRFAITGQHDDRHVFRVPSLRNVAITAPYFHDGRTASLAHAVEIMARDQLGRELPKQDVQLIVQFLGTLTGEYRGHPLTRAVDPVPP